MDPETRDTETTEEEKEKEKKEKEKQEKEKEVKIKTLDTYLKRKKPENSSEYSNECYTTLFNAIKYIKIQYLKNSLHKLYEKKTIFDMDKEINLEFYELGNLNFDLIEKIKLNKMLIYDFHMRYPETKYTFNYFLNKIDDYLTNDNIDTYLIDPYLKEYTKKDIKEDTILFKTFFKVLLGELSSIENITVNGIQIFSKIHTRDRTITEPSLIKIMKELLKIVSCVCKKNEDSNKDYINYNNIFLKLLICLSFTLNDTHYYYIYAIIELFNIENLKLNEFNILKENSDKNYFFSNHKIDKYINEIALLFKMSKNEIIKKYFKEAIINIEITSNNVIVKKTHRYTFIYNNDTANIKIIIGYVFVFETYDFNEDVITINMLFRWANNNEEIKKIIMLYKKSIEDNHFDNYSHFSTPEKVINLYKCMLKDETTVKVDDNKKHLFAKLKGIIHECDAKKQLFNIIKDNFKNTNSSDVDYDLFFNDHLYLNFDMTYRVRNLEKILQDFFNKKETETDNYDTLLQDFSNEYITVEAIDQYNRDHPDNKLSKFDNILFINEIPDLETLKRSNNIFDYNKILINIIIIYNIFSITDIIHDTDIIEEIIKIFSGANTFSNPIINLKYKKISDEEDPFYEKIKEKLNKEYDDILPKTDIIFKEQNIFIKKSYMYVIYFEPKVKEEEKENSQYKIAAIIVTTQTFDLKNNICLQFQKILWVLPNSEIVNIMKDIEKIYKNSKKGSSFNTLANFYYFKKNIYFLLNLYKCMLYGGYEKMTFTEELGEPPSIIDRLKYKYNIFKELNPKKIKASQVLGGLFAGTGIATSALAMATPFLGGKKNRKSKKTKKTRKSKKTKKNRKSKNIRNTKRVKNQ